MREKMTEQEKSEWYKVSELMGWSRTADRISTLPLDGAEELQQHYKEAARKATEEFPISRKLLEIYEGSRTATKEEVIDDLRELYFLHEKGCPGGEWMRHELLVPAMGGPFVKIVPTLADALKEAKEKPEAVVKALDQLGTYIRVAPRILEVEYVAKYGDWGGQPLV